MELDRLTWLATILKDLERTKFTGEVRLSYYDGFLQGKVKQVTEIKKP